MPKRSPNGWSPIKTASENGSDAPNWRAFEAQAGARSEGQRRRLTLWLSASLLALFVFGGGVGWAILQQRQARREQVELALGKPYVLLEQARADPNGEVRKWDDALLAVDQIENIFGTKDSGREKLAALDRQIDEGRRQAELDQTLLGRLDEIRASKRSDLGATWAPSDSTASRFADAFHDRGIDVETPALKTAADLLKSRPKNVVAKVAAALDDWASQAGTNHALPQALVDKIVALARAVDPDPWRDRLRDLIAAGQPNKRLDEYRRLAAELRRSPELVAKMQAQTITLLASLLVKANDNPAAVALLRFAALPPRRSLDQLRPRPRS